MENRTKCWKISCQIFNHKLILITIIIALGFFCIILLSQQQNCFNSIKFTSNKIPFRSKFISKFTTKAPTIFTTISSTSTTPLKEKKSERITCYDDRFLDEVLEPHKLPDIFNSTRLPRLDKSIFFHETSCKQLGLATLTARQACAIESAALTNPNRDVFLMFTSPTALSNETDNRYLKAIQSYPNVYLRNLNLWNYAVGTPLYELLENGELFRSKYLVSHVSDFLRYLTLYHFGGTYLDLDVIMKKSLENIEPNYTGAQEKEYLAVGIINLESNGTGHKIAEILLKTFRKNFNGKFWGSNGPEIMNIALKKICRTNKVSLMTREKCLGFTTYKPDVFYAVSYPYWRELFKEDAYDKAVNKTRNSISVHFWNKLSKDEPIRIGSKNLYGKLAEEFCPKVYKSIVF